METDTTTAGMHRSVSMTDTPKTINPRTLVRSDEFETLDEIPSESEMSLDHEFFSKDINAKLDIQKKNHKENWAGSTIELNVRKHSTKSARQFDRTYMKSRKSIQLKSGRVIQKNGVENVNNLSMKGRSWKFFKDIVTTLIEWDWKYMLLLFFTTYIGSWFIFSLIWYLIGYAHGDIPYNVPSKAKGHHSREPCLKGAYDLTSMFLFSFELQTTIGTGEKYPTDECPEGVFIFILQVCYRNNKLCLMFRVSDPQEQHSIELKVRAYLLIDKITNEGEVVKVNTELKLLGNGSNFIMWPETLIHVIDCDSPFYNFTAEDFHSENYEVFVSIFGSSPLTAQVSEDRTSYLPKEVFWGQRFNNIIHYDKLNNSYFVDFKNFNSTSSVSMEKLEDRSIK
uniref:Inward rectifier potassium channel C-terminal domain-containing protein n=1 Tax=Megaselia scalaris TaxID=36166 RepID=T1GM41_MEGSC